MMPKAIQRARFYKSKALGFAGAFAIPAFLSAMGYPVLLSVCYVPLLLLSPSWVFVVSALATVTYVFATLAGIGDFGMPLGLTAQTFTLLLWRVRAKFAPTVWPNPPSDGQGIAKRVLIAAGIYAAALASFKSYPWADALLMSASLFLAGAARPGKAMPHWGRAVGTLLLLAISIAAGGSIVELGLRMMGARPRTLSDLYEPDRDAIFTLRPNAKGTFELRDNDGARRVVPAEISPQGVRNAALGPKGTNEFRIVVLGDSYAMGHGLYPEETVAQLLANNLNAAKLTKRITAINCGVGGYAPWQERIFLRNRSFQFDPDLVLLQVFPANDVAGSLAQEDKYLLAVDLEWEQRLNSFRRQGEPAFRAQRWLEGHVCAFTAIETIFKSQNLAAGFISDFRWYPASTWKHPVQKVERSPYREASLLDTYPELDEAYALLERDIRAIKADCDARSIDMAAFAHPFPMTIIEDGWAEADRQAVGKQFELDKDVRLTGAIFERAGIPHADVAGPLESVSDQERLYFIHDGHWTPEGARVVAQALTEFLLTTYFPHKFSGQQ